MHKMCLQKIETKWKACHVYRPEKANLCEQKIFDLGLAGYALLQTCIVCICTHIMQLAHQSARGLGERIDGWFFRNGRRQREANPTSHPVTGQTQIA